VTEPSASSGVAGELSRDLKLHHVVMMGLGMMIGAGVFVGIGLSVREAGPGGLLLTFALNGLIALFTAMSFAELASAIPRAGGAYNFARIGFGRGASFIAGWTEWFASSLAGAFYAIVFARYTLDFVNITFALDIGPDARLWLEKALALAAAGLFIYVNYRGSGETGRLGVIFTALQMLFVLGIGVAGMVTFARHGERLANFQPLFTDAGWLALLGTMGVIYVAFEGFEVIAQAGDETVEPRRNLPKAMLYSVLIVTLSYLAVAAASIVAVHDVPGDIATYAQAIEGSGGSFFREAVAKLVPYGGFLVTLAVIFSATSALNATVYSATRASFALGRDGMLPPVFARLATRRRTPYVALAFTAAIVLTASMLLDPEAGAAAASMMFLCLFFMVNLCVIRIRVHMGDELEYGFLMPLFPLFPILAIGCQIALAGGIFGESLPAIVLAGVWVPAGFCVYMLYSRRKAPAGEHEIQVIDEPPTRKAPDEYRIMVSVANPANAVQMVRTTYKLAAAHNANVRLLHMVPVPPQVPLEDADKYMLDGREGMIETMLYLGPQFPITTAMRYCRNVARGILSAVRDHHSDMLILGWHGRPRRRAFRMGSTIDPIIGRCPAPVVVLTPGSADHEYRRVLVPVGGGPYGGFALEIAAMLAEPDGEITAMTVAQFDRPPVDVEAFLAEHADQLPAQHAPIRPHVVTSRHVAQAILAAAESHDLIVLGCSREPLLRRVTRRSLPEVLARQSQIPLAMVKTSGRIRSWIKRWI